MNIEKKQYTKTQGHGTFNNYRTYDEITEYSFTTTQKLGYERVLEVLRENGINLYGFVDFLQKEIDFDIEKMAKVYEYTAREVMC